jgi:hypothetical protein
MCPPKEKCLQHRKKNHNTLLKFLHREGVAVAHAQPRALRRWQLRLPPAARVEECAGHAKMKITYNHEHQKRTVAGSANAPRVMMLHIAHVWPRVPPPLRAPPARPP